MDLAVAFAEVLKGFAFFGVGLEFVGGGTEASFDWARITGVPDAVSTRDFRSAAGLDDMDRADDGGTARLPGAAGVSGAACIGGCIGGSVDVRLADAASVFAKLPVDVQFEPCADGAAGRETSVIAIMATVIRVPRDGDAVGVPMQR